MLWDEQTWKKMRDRMFRAARAMGAQEADAEDMASKAALALLEGVERCADPDNPEEIVNPSGYMWGSLGKIRHAHMKSRDRDKAIADALHEDLGPGNEVDQGTLEALELAAALEQVLRFGRNQGRGTTTLVLRASRINLSSVKMMLRYLSRVLEKAPVDPKTRRKGLKLFARLMRQAMDRVKLDPKHYPEDPGAFEQRPEGFIVGEDHQRPLSGNAGAGLRLLRLLFPRMPEPVAIEHAVAVEEEVWQGRRFGQSGFMYLHTPEHTPENEDLDELIVQLKRLWQWEDGGVLVLTVTEPRKIDLRVTAREKAFLVEAPTGEQCFGAPLPHETEEVLREVFEYDPPNEEVDCNYTILEPERAEHMGDVAKFLLGTLEHVYGWDPDDGVEWECVYDGWEE